MKDFQPLITLKRCIIDLPRVRSTEDSTVSRMESKVPILLFETMLPLLNPKSERCVILSYFHLTDIQNESTI